MPNKSEIENLVEAVNAAEPQPIPAEFATLEAMLDNEFEMARRYFIEKGNDELYPTWTMLTASGQTMVVVTPFEGGGENKPVVAAAMRMLMARTHVLRYTFASEAWAVAATEEERQSGDFDETPPSQRPDRVEILVILGSDNAGNTRARTYEMIRDDAGKLTDLRLREPPSEAKGEATFTGRFANLLTSETRH